MDFIILSNLTNLIWAVIAIATLFGVARMSDRLIGFNFKEWINALAKSGSDSSGILCIYFGLRFIGLCILAGAIFS